MATKRSGIALFDVDGPLRGGNISAWSEFLYEEGMFSKKALKKCRTDIEEMKSGKITYKQFAQKTLNHFAEGVRGKSPAEVKRAAEKYARTPEVMQLHPYAVELVERMNQRGITIAITGQPQEFIDAMRVVLPFHITIGTELEVRNGKYTGKVKRNLALDKEFVVKEIKKHPSYWKGLKYGFGDRITDVQMLRHTTKPVALNPDAKMERSARSRGWIVAKGKQILRRIRRR